MVLTDGFLRYRIRRQGEVCFLRVEAYDMAADDWREEEPEQRFASRLKLISTFSGTSTCFLIFPPPLQKRRVAHFVPIGFGGNVVENVEMADIQAIQTRIKKHNLLTVALLIPLFAGCALRHLFSHIPSTIAETPRRSFCPNRLRRERSPFLAYSPAIQTRIKKHNLLTVALLIPLFAGCALRESSETLGARAGGCPSGGFAGTSPSTRAAASRRPYQK